jgi:hypothetical protein
MHCVTVSYGVHDVALVLVKHLEPAEHKILCIEGCSIQRVRIACDLAESGLVQRLRSVALPIFHLE